MRVLHSCFATVSSTAQDDLQAASRRLTSLEASVASQLPECVALSRRLAARQADAEARGSTVTDKVRRQILGRPASTQAVPSFACVRPLARVTN